MIKRNTILLTLLIAGFANAQNRIFLKQGNAVDVKYVTVDERYLIITKSNDSIKMERRIPIEVIDSLYCDDTKFIQKAYNRNEKYRRLFRNTNVELRIKNEALKSTIDESRNIDTIQIMLKPKRFLYKGEFISYEKLHQILSTSGDADIYLKRAMKNNRWAFAIAYGGGMLIGAPLGYMLGSGGNTSLLPMAGVGVGFILIAIPFSVAYEKNINLAIKAYNRNHKAGN